MKKEKKYEYGCVMLYFDFPSMFKIQDIINPKDIYEEEDDNTYGLEKHPHTTLLYGLHEGVTVKQIKGRKYIEILDDKNANKFKATPNKAVYSMTNGLEIDIPIKFG